MDRRIATGWQQGLGAAAVLLALAPAARATPLTAGQILSTYNLVTTGNVSTSSDIEGSAVIGGNLDGSGTFFNNHVPANPVVYLYGQQTGNYNLDAGGSLYYSGAPGGTVNYNGGGKLVSSGPPQPLTDFTAPLNALASSLAGLSANSTVASANNTLTFNAVAGTGGQAVVTLNGTTLMPTWPAPPTSRSTSAPASPRWRWTCSPRRAAPASASRAG